MIVPQQHVKDAGRGLLLVQLGSGERTRIYHDKNDLLDLAGGYFAAKQWGHVIGGKKTKRFADSEIVGDSAIQKVDVLFPPAGAL